MRRTIKRSLSQLLKKITHHNENINIELIIDFTSICYVLLLISEHIDLNNVKSLKKEENTTRAHKLDGKIPLKEIPNLMISLGHYPSH